MVNNNKRLSLCAVQCLSIESIDWSIGRVVAISAAIAVAILVSDTISGLIAHRVLRLPLPAVSAHIFQRELCLPLEFVVCLLYVCPELVDVTQTTIHYLERDADSSGFLECGNHLMTDCITPD